MLWCVLAVCMTNTLEKIVTYIGIALPIWKTNIWSRKSACDAADIEKYNIYKHVTEPQRSVSNLLLLIKWLYISWTMYKMSFIIVCIQMLNVQNWALLLRLVCIQIHLKVKTRSYSFHKERVKDVHEGILVM